MALTPQKRSALIHLINTGTSTTPKWSIVNEGVTTLTEEFNPDVETMQYVAEDSKTSFVKSYGASLTITMSVVDPEKDEVSKYLLDKITNLPVGAAADTEYIRCCLLNKVDGETAKYTAYKQPANISISNFGGAADEYLGAEVVLNGKGDAQKGTLTVAKSGDTITYTFEKDAATA